MPEKKRPRKRARPKASRPYMPDYGILDARSGRGLLPWSWATQRLAISHNYWIATTRPDGTPHAMPVWGVWLDKKFYFSTGRNSRKARNLAVNPKCVVSTERANEAVIVEGIAEETPRPSRLRKAARAYKKKYDWELDPSLGPIFVVRPRVAFGFIENPGEFTGTATRWRFE